MKLKNPVGATPVFIKDYRENLDQLETIINKITDDANEVGDIRFMYLNLPTQAPDWHAEKTWGNLLFWAFYVAAPETANGYLDPDATVTIGPRSISIETPDIYVLIEERFNGELYDDLFIFTAFETEEEEG